MRLLLLSISLAVFTGCVTKTEYVVKKCERLYEPIKITLSDDITNEEFIEAFNKLLVNYETLKSDYEACTY